ncbi:Balbiani ring protein 3, partial [Clarias magur]
ATATVRVLNCRCPLDATRPQQKCDATVRVFNCRCPLDALPTCLNRCLVATCDVIRCCLRNRS